MKNFCILIICVKCAVSEAQKNGIELQNVTWDQQNQKNSSPQPNYQYSQVENDFFPRQRNIFENWPSLAPPTAHLRVYQYTSPYFTFISPFKTDLEAIPQRHQVDKQNIPNEGYLQPLVPRPITTYENNAYPLVESSVPVHFGFSGNNQALHVIPHWLLQRKKSLSSIQVIEPDLSRLLPARRFLFPENSTPFIRSLKTSDVVHRNKHTAKKSSPAAMELVDQNIKLKEIVMKSSTTTTEMSNVNGNATAGLPGTKLVLVKSTRATEMPESRTPIVHGVFARKTQQVSPSKTDVVVTASSSYSEIPKINAIVSAAPTKSYKSFDMKDFFETKCTKSKPYKIAVIIGLPRNESHINATTVVEYQRQKYPGTSAKESKLEIPEVKYTVIPSKLGPKYSPSNIRPDGVNASVRPVELMSKSNKASSLTKLTKVLLANATAMKKNRKEKSQLVNTTAITETTKLKRHLYIKDSSSENPKPTTAKETFALTNRSYLAENITLSTNDTNVNASDYVATEIVEAINNASFTLTDAIYHCITVINLFQALAMTAGRIANTTIDAFEPLNDSYGSNLYYFDPDVENVKILNENLQGLIESALSAFFALQDKVDDLVKTVEEHSQTFPVLSSPANSLSNETVDFNTKETNSAFNSILNNRFVSKDKKSLNHPSSHIKSNSVIDKKSVSKESKYKFEDKSLEDDSQKLPDETNYPSETDPCFG